MRILFLVPYPLQVSPSQRFRFEQYFSLLKNKNADFRVCSYLTNQGWSDLYCKRKSAQKVWYLVSGYLLRLLHLFYARSADFVFIHRETAPVGPPFLEWLIWRVLRKKIIYDFDDAIWLTDKKNESIIEQTIRWRGKVTSICHWSYKVSCGNKYLQQYALQFNPVAVLNPTTLDTENLHNPSLYQIQEDADRIVIGWTGSHSTLKYLYLQENVLLHIQNRFPQVDMLVIADKEPSMKLERIIYKPWSKESEIKDLILADIGIMPLPDDEWSKGKCGFKALQYMALEIPAVVSPVGVNTEIIQHEVNGFLCSTDEKWIVTLEKLIQDATLRKQIGKAGRQTVIDHYSVSSNSVNFLSLFE